jgi:hypothetical protein
MTRQARRAERQTEWVDRFNSQRNYRNAFNPDTGEIRQVGKSSNGWGRNGRKNGHPPFVNRSERVRLVATVGGDHKAAKLQAHLTA